MALLRRQIGLHLGSDVVAKMLDIRRRECTPESVLLHSRDQRIHGLA